MLTAIDRHNARLGGRVQRAAQVAAWLLLVGPLCHVLLRLLFRVRVTGAEHMLRVRGPSIFAAEHFWEWDSLAVWCLAVWPRAWGRRHLVPYPFVGGPWVATRLRRMGSWVLGLPGLARGVGAERQSAYALARRIASGPPPPPAFVICPTGALGREAEGRLHAGVAHLADCAPAMAVHPVALTGFRSLRLAEVLQLGRPVIGIHIGAPFTVEGVPDDAARRALLERIAGDWRSLHAARGS